MFSASKTAAPSTGYNLQKSLRLRSSASAYLNRTPASNGNLTTWTWSAWVKRGAISNGNNQVLMGSNTVGEERIGFNSDDTFIYYNWNGSYSNEQITTQVFRDPSAWYHIIVVRDTTNATASNRIRIYVNGQQVTSFSTNITPSQNASSYDFNTTASHQIGRWPTGIQYFDGYLAEVNFIDGQALTASSFGSFNSVTGVWQPAKYTGTYGTNGFYLPFTNTSSTTTLGYDFSGNGNNWTTNNISLTAGSTYDSMTDVPTLTSPTVANYEVINPLNKSSSTYPTVANGNLDVSVLSSNGSSGVSNAVSGTLAVSSGKWYYEMLCNSASGYFLVGMAKTSLAITSNFSSGVGANNSFLYYGFNGQKYNGAGGASYGATWTTNDVIGVAIDLDGGSITYYKNGVSQGVAYTWTPDGSSFYPIATGDGSNNTTSASFNFGQRPFAYTPPTGFVALNTYNLPTSTIVKGNTVMDATLYTGNGSTQSIVNASGFQPDLVWAKDRTTTNYHALYDSVRGATLDLQSNTTTAEQTFAGGLTSFNSNGFTTGNNSDTNTNGDAFVAWQWQAGKGTTSSNTNGSITSTVSVNASAGFSIVTYTGTGANATVGHGLGVAPSLIFIKQRTGTARAWQVYHASLGAGGGLYLNQTNAYTADSSAFNNTAPTSSVFSLGSSVYPNQSGSAIVAYCWAAVPGFSAFGSYTGNGSTDGPFVYLGFRPKFVMVKRTDGTQDWVLHDSVRDPYNTTTNSLYPDLSAAENSGFNNKDFLSNGFKIRNTTSGGENVSGGTYIYMAFAENPFKNALAR